MNGAEARELAWSIGADVTAFVAVVVVILIGLAVLGEWR